MSERHSGGGPNLALLLLIPAAVIVAKGAARRRAMWESSWTPEGASGFGRGHGHGHGYGPRRFGGDMEGGSFRLPPRIEWMLDSLPTRAHKKAAEGADTAPDGEETETA